MIDDILSALGYSRKESQDSKNGIDPNYEYAKTRYDGYLRDRQAYLKESLEISDRFDKAILALSGGSLALSLTFIEKIAPNPLEWSLWFLLASWLLLILSVLSGIYALAASQMAIQREIAHLDQSYKDFLKAYEEGDVNAIPNRVPNGNRAVRWTQGLNIFSMICLGMGVLLLCIFSLINMRSKTGVNPQVLQVQLQYPPTVTPPVPAAPSLVVPSSTLHEVPPAVTSPSQNPKVDDHEQQTKPAR